MKEKVVQITFCTFFILIISVMGILTLMNNNELSVKEGRKLTTFPKVTLNSVLSSSFYTELTNAFADQLAYREDLIKIYYLLNLQRYTGDVVKGEDNQLFLSPLIIPTSIIDAIMRGTMSSRLASNNLKRGPRIASLTYPLKYFSSFFNLNSNSCRRRIAGRNSFMKN